MTCGLRAAQLRFFLCKEQRVGRGKARSPGKPVMLPMSAAWTTAAHPGKSKGWQASGYPPSLW
jgi:hypothetical protein